MVAIFLVVNSIWINSPAQVSIWQENFESYPDGTTSGNNLNTSNSSVDWTSGGCLACVDTADWWEVRSGAMEARDVNQLVDIQTEVIDISGFSNVLFSVDIEELGDHEGLYFGLDTCEDQQNEDFVNVLYRTNGGPWMLVENFLSWCGLYSLCGSHTLYGDDGINSGDCRDHDADWGSVTIIQPIISATSLELRIEAINSSDTEIIRIDNILVTGDIILPVRLQSFTASAHGNRVDLYWQTASEINNDYFQVERAKQDLLFDWEPLDVVPGAGNSKAILNYSYQDLNPYNGKSFYRLKQVDLDGSIEYSAIKSVFVAPGVTPYPIPASDYLIIPYTGNINQLISIKLVDVSHRLIVPPVTYGNSYARLDLNAVASGVYMLLTGYGKQTNQYKITVVD